MQIDFTLLDELFTDAPGTHREPFNTNEGEILTPKPESQEEAEKTPQETQEEARQAIKKLYDKCNISNYLQDAPKPQEKEQPKEELKEVIERLAREHGTGRQNTATDAPGSPQSHFNSEDDKKDAIERKAQDKPWNSPCFVKLEREQGKLERARLVYEEYQDNIKKSETIRAAIAKEILAGEASPQETLKKAIECISLMTGDKTYYNTLISYTDRREK